MSDMATTTGSVPVPDPTERTIQGLKVAIDAQEKLFEARIVAVEGVFNTHLRLLNQRTSDMKDWLESQLLRLEQTRAERFLRTDIQFAERDKRTEQLAIANATAIGAALQAAKEISSQINASFAKQIDQLTELFQANNKSVDEKINDIKSRLDRGEGIARGGTQIRGEHRDNQTLMIGLAAAISAIVGVVINLLIRH